MMTRIVSLWHFFLLLLVSPVEAWMAVGPGVLALVFLVLLLVTARKVRWWKRRYRYREGLNELLRETEELEKKREKK
jgi:membrane protein YdbS with pleckstrin-like domain